MSDPNDHRRRLERMYLAAPINRFYRPRIEIGDATAKISIDVDERLFHSAGGVHGSVYFKLLDDAGYFAASSLEPERFVLTSSFTTSLTRPVGGGTMTGEGRVIDRTRSQFVCEAVVRDADGRPVGHGHGVYVRGTSKLVDALGYAAPDEAP